MRNLTFTFVLALAPLSVALAQTDDGEMQHSESMDHSQMMSGEHASMEGVHATGTLNSIATDKVNISHGPIAEIGWPAMTMELPLLEGAELGEVEAGDEVVIMLEKGDDGMYGVKALMPKE